MIFESVNGGGGEDTDLTHGSAEDFAEASGLLHVFFVADEDGADGAAEAFGEADRDRIEGIADIPEGIATGDDGVEDAGTVEVELEAAVASPFTDAEVLIEWISFAAADVGGVFQTEEARSGEVDAGWSPGFFEFFDIKHAEGTFDVLAGDTAEQGRAAGFVVGDVAVLFDVEFVAGLAVNLDGQLVCHGSRGSKDSCFHTAHFGDHGFEAIGGGVFADHVIADDGVENGFTHGGRGLGFGVAAEVDLRSLVGGVRHGVYC